MKVCPVCQYEEEEDSEVSCAICGSDLESDSIPSEDSDVKESVAKEENTDVEKSVMENEKTDVKKEVSENISKEVPEMTDEEKEIEEALAATEIPKSDTKESLAYYNSYFHCLTLDPVRRQGHLRHLFYFLSSFFLLLQ